MEAGLTYLLTNLLTNGFRRAEEVAWLRSLSWPSNVVAHRGFHSPSDLDRRPIENSLEAYEMAWTAGVKLCECDVAVTSDGQIVLGAVVSIAMVSMARSSSVTTLTANPNSDPDPNPDRGPNPNPNPNLLCDDRPRRGLRAAGAQDPGCFLQALDEGTFPSYHPSASLWHSRSQAATAARSR